MEKDKYIDINEAAEKLKKELSLVNDSDFRTYLTNPTPIKESEKVSLIDTSSLSDEARYIFDNYHPIGTDDYNFPVFQDDETEIMAAIIQSLPKDDQQQLMTAFDDSPLSWQIPTSSEAKNFEGKRQERQLSINTLMSHFSQGIKGKKVKARSQLRSRFEYQSFADQMKIMRLFLAGTKSDREWCYKTMLRWWDDELTADLEQAWLDHKDEKCVKTAVMRLPEDFIKAHQVDMGVLDYKSVCRRLAHDEHFVIDKTRLHPSDYCFVIAHNHRHISDQEADQLLFGQIKHALEFKFMPLEFKTHYGQNVKDRMEDKTRYLPSLSFIKSVGYMIWALGQTGNTATIIKFHRLNKMLQTNMPQYLAEEMDPKNMLDFMHKDFRAYQEWNWRIFTKHAEIAIAEIDTSGYDEFLETNDYFYAHFRNVTETMPPDEFINKV